MGERNVLQYEQSLWQEGYTAIAGVDEVGRGCLFGDVVAAAVILPPGLVIDGVNDSKKLSEKKRDQLYDIILQECVAWSAARVDAQTVDRINIKQAARLAMRIAVESLQIPSDYLLIDAEKVDVALPQMSIIKGDATSQSIAAASIVAKVTRDRLCATEWEKEYPAYGIAIHKGYATKLHREKLLEHGPSALHRRSFLGNLFTKEQLLDF
ncbi:ribonuclease HII [Paenibacillus sp. FSL H8-0548]|nr:ribonuclease HII [Paenibacillus sp. FSL H8-0548]